MVVHSTKKTNGIAAPSISFVAKIKMSEGRNSWKGKYNGPNDIINAECGGASDIKECIESKTFHRREFMMDALLGWTQKESLMEDNLWSSDFTYSRAGMVHTLKVRRRKSNHLLVLQVPQRLGPLFNQDYVMFYLNHSFQS